MVFDQVYHSYISFLRFKVWEGEIPHSSKTLKNEAIKLKLFKVKFLDKAKSHNFPRVGTVWKWWGAVPWKWTFIYYQVYVSLTQQTVFFRLLRDIYPSVTVKVTQLGLKWVFYWVQNELNAPLFRLFKKFFQNFAKKYNNFPEICFNAQFDTFLKLSWSKGKKFAS